MNTATYSAVVTDGELCDDSTVDEQCDSCHFCVSDREYTVEEKQACFEDGKYVGRPNNKDSSDESLGEQLDTTIPFLRMRGLILLNAKALK